MLGTKDFFPEPSSPWGSGGAGGGSFLFLYLDPPRDISVRPKPYSRRLALVVPQVPSMAKPGTRPPASSLWWTSPLPLLPTNRRPASSARQFEIDLTRLLLIKDRA